MNLAELREQLAGALETAEMTVARHRSDPIAEYPAAVISVDSFLNDTFGDATGTAQCVVTVLVSKADTEDGWTRLDQLLSDDTIADAFRTATDIECTVGAYDNIGDEVEHNGGVFYGFTIGVEVLT